MHLNRAGRSYAAVLTWTAGATTALAVGLATNSLSGAKLRLHWAIPAAVSFALAALGYLERSRRPASGLLIASPLSIWPQNWVKPVQEYVREYHLATTQIVVPITVSQLGTVPIAEKLAKRVRDWQKAQVEIPIRRSDSTAIFLNSPTPVCFSLGAQLREMKSIRVFQLKGNSSGGVSSFFEAVDLRRRPKSMRWARWLSEQHVAGTGGTPGVTAVILDISKNPISPQALQDAWARGATNAMIVTFADATKFLGKRRSLREVPESRRAMSGITRACETILIRHLDALAESGGAPSKVLLYIRMPVSMAFALGYQLKRNSFDYLYQQSDSSPFIQFIV